MDNYHVGSVPLIEIELPGGARGLKGDQGPKGDKGDNYNPIIEEVETLEPTQPATAEVRADNNNIYFSFGIPKGDPGEGTKLSDFDNDVGFVTADTTELENYALINNTYTKTEVDNSLSSKANTSEVNAALATKANISDVIDNLTSTETAKPLSAKQGKILKDTLDEQEEKVNKKPYVFNNVASMKVDNTLADGMSVQTLGYYEINDGGHGEYVIVDDDTLVDDGGSIHVLNNGLRAKLIIDNYINVKQFGAKGNNLNDDTQSIQNAINQNVGNIIFPKGEYVITSQLVIKNHNYIGYNAEIVISKDSDTEYLIYNENYSSNANTNTFSFHNINFKLIKGGNGSNYILSFKNIKNVIFDKCRFYTINDFNKPTHLLDLRCNSENVTIRDCDFYIDEADSSTRATCLLVRNYQGDSNSYTNNITIDNCTFNKNCTDEILWINSDSGLLTNVNVYNCKIIDNANGSNSIWFGASPSGTIKNCKLNDSYIYKETLNSRVITLGMKSAETDTPTIKDISVNDCDIYINDTSNGNYTYIILGEKTISSNISINNTKIKYDNTNLLRYCFHKIQNINNCNVDISSESATDNIVFSNVDNVNGGKYTTSGLVTDYPIDINNVEIDCKRLLAFTYANTGTNNFNIINSTFKTSEDLIDTSYNTAIINLLFKNCIIKNTKYLSNFYSVSNSTDSSIYLIDTDISNDNLIKSNKPTLYLYNVTLNNKMLTGIPTNANTKGACAIGTIIPSVANSTTHAFVKKISDGDTDSNWTEI